MNKLISNDSWYCTFIGIGVIWRIANIKQTKDCCFCMQHSNNASNVQEIRKSWIRVLVSIWPALAISYINCELLYLKSIVKYHQDIMTAPGPPRPAVLLWRESIGVNVGWTVYWKPRLRPSPRVPQKAQQRHGTQSEVLQCCCVDLRFVLAWDDPGR
jgi:hypothetical protein